MARIKASNGLIVRRARASDLEALNLLYEQLHVPDYGEYKPSLARMQRAFEGVARDRNHTLLVAQSDGSIVGTAHVLIFRHLGHGLRPAAIVENVVVDERSRSLGIGEHLMAAALEVARRAGCYKLSLTSNVVRKRAHQFYQRLGFERSHFGYSIRLKPAE